MLASRKRRSARWCRPALLLVTLATLLRPFSLRLDTIDIRGRQGEGDGLWWPRPRKQFGGRSVGHDPSAVDDHSTRADCFDLFRANASETMIAFEGHCAQEFAYGMLLVKGRSIGGSSMDGAPAGREERRREPHPRLKPSTVCRWVDRGRIEVGFSHRVAEFAPCFRSGVASHLGYEGEECRRGHVAIGRRRPLEGNDQRWAPIVASTINPQTRTRPEEGARKPCGSFMVVDLPAPLGPQESQHFAPANLEVRFRKRLRLGEGFGSGRRFDHGGERIARVSGKNRSPLRIGDSGKTAK